MKHLKLFSSHTEYEAGSASISSPCVIYDKEHIHYVQANEDTNSSDTDMEKLDINNTDLNMNLD